MKAIVLDHPGGPEVLHLAEVPDPVLHPGDVLLEVRASAVNRADTLQRQGLYPPPPGASEIIGLEASGTVAALAEGATGWRIGDQACALLSGGGYAELAAAPAAQLMPIPAGLDLLTAAAVPEAFLTAHDNLVTRARLRAGEIVLIQGGAGGVGTAAIQVARRAGATVLTTAGSAERLERCRELGATGLINHRTDDVPVRVRALTAGRGVDVILDVMGASHLAANLGMLAPDGRLVVIGLQGGTRAEIDLGAMMRGRQSLINTALRGRPPDQKAAIVATATAEVLPGFADGSLRAVVHAVFPLAEAAAAHFAMEAGGHVGKLVLDVQGGATG
jgi:putative PIG3 family NAD(P)H quinone oxidoreductase